MSARIDAMATVLRPMTAAGLDGVLELEQAVYPFPWTRGNFVDSLVAGYAAWTLNHVDGDLVGYCIAMSGVGEMHLLNITIAPAARRRGHARRLLAELVQQCRAREATPSARALLRLAAQAWSAGSAVDPALALPLYVRDKVAETEAERAARRAGTVP